MARPNIGQGVSLGFEVFKKNPITFVVGWLILAAFFVTVPISVKGQYLLAKQLTDEGTI